MLSVMSASLSPEIDLRIETISATESYGSIFTLVAEYAQKLELTEFNFDTWRELDSSQRAALYERAYDLKAQEDAESRAAATSQAELYHHSLASSAQHDVSAVVRARPEVMIEARSFRHRSHSPEDDDRPRYASHHIQHAETGKSERIINAILNDEALYIGRLF